MSVTYIGQSDRAGISISYIKSKRVLDISGWYDTCVGIEGQRLTLREFFDRTGISMNDCKKAFLGDGLGSGLIK